MPGLAEAHFAATGKLDRGDCTPSLLSHGIREFGALGLQILHGVVDLVGHQVQLITRFAVRRVNGDFGRRRRENQLTVSGVDGT
jgi:hypothetical protein